MPTGNRKSKMQQADDRVYVKSKGKERGREQELTGKELAKRIAKGSELGIENRGKICSEEHGEVRRGTETDIAGKIVSKKLAKRNERGLVRINRKIQCEREIQSGREQQQNNNLITEG